MTLTIYKAKLVGAKKGYELLKKKSDALKVRKKTSGFERAPIALMSFLALRLVDGWNLEVLRVNLASSQKISEDFFSSPLKMCKRQEPGPSLLLRSLFPPLAVV